MGKTKKDKYLKDNLLDLEYNSLKDYEDKNFNNKYKIKRRGRKKSNINDEVDQYNNKNIDLEYENIFV